MILSVPKVIVMHCKLLSFLGVVVLYFPATDNSQQRYRRGGVHYAISRGAISSFKLGGQKPKLRRNFRVAMFLFNLLIFCHKFCTKYSKS